MNFGPGDKGILVTGGSSGIGPPALPHCFTTLRQGNRVKEQDGPKESKHSSFFVKKEAKKLSILLVHSGETPGNQLKKVFCFFFSKKKCFPCFAPRTLSRRIDSRQSDPTGNAV